MPPVNFCLVIFWNQNETESHDKDEAWSEPSHTCREEAAMREVEEAGGLTVLIFQMCVLDLMISYRPLFFGL